MVVSDKDSWKMRFRGSAIRTGVSASRIPCKPSLLWVKEVGPSVSSPVFVDGTVYVSTITGKKYTSKEDFLADKAVTIFPIQNMVFY